MNIQQAREVYLANPEAAKHAEEKFQALLARSATDLEFRQKLLSDPRSAVAEFTGSPIPEDWNVVFVENRGSATVVLPDPIDPNAELSEAELEAVAGGGTITILSIIATIGYIVTD